MILFILLGIVLGALTVIFALQNVATVTVTFFAWQLTGSLSVVLFVTLIAGVVVSLLVSLPEVIKNHFAVRDMKRKQQALIDENVLLKKQLEDAHHLTQPQTPKPASSNLNGTKLA
jgi:uncharacterized integral membrane protein